MKSLKEGLKRMVGTSGRASMRGAESEDGEQLQKHGTAPPGSMAEAKEGGAAAAAKAAAKPEEKKPAAAAKPAATKWKAVTDARTGRTYYYDPVTLETRWEKPLDTEELEKQQSFFAEMEANIRAKLRSNGGLSCDFAEDDLAEFAAGGGGGGRGGGRVPAAPSDVGVDGRAIDRQAATPFPSIQQTADRAAAEGGGGGTRASGGGGSGGGGGGIFDFKRVRTLSSVDDSVMRESDQQFYDSGAASDAVAKRAAARARDEAAAAAGSSSGGGGGGGGSVGEAPPPISLRLAEAKSEQPPDDGDGGGGGSRSRRSSETDASENRGARPRCNTTSTIVVDATMSAPDRDATIQCVCTCFRAHMVEAVAQGRTVGADIRFRIFNEALDTEGAGPLATLGSDVPTVQALAHFMRTIFSRSQMESECIIMSLVYIERLLKQSHMPLNLRNWRPVMMICMVLASKIWDDLSMWNSDFSKVNRSFTLQRINELELSLLELIQYNVRVSASTYARYYFHLRSMAAKLGLRSGPSETSPLDIAGARKMQLQTEHYDLSRAKGVAADIRRRSKTLGGGVGTSELEQLAGGAYAFTQATKPTVSLDQLMQPGQTLASGSSFHGMSKSGRGTPEVKE